MNINRKTLTCATTAAIASVGVSQAADIENMTIQDVTGDGVSGAFANPAVPAPGSTNYTQFFDSTSSVTFTPFIGTTITITPTNAMGITANGVGEGTAAFTAGFLFANAPFGITSLNEGTGDSCNATLPDGIDGVVSSGDTSLAMTQFHWGSQFGSSCFNHTPIFFHTNIAWQNPGTGSDCDEGTTNVCYQLAWDSDIEPPTLPVIFDHTIWAIEGVAKLDGPVNLVNDISISGNVTQVEFMRGTQFPGSSTYQAVTVVSVNDPTSGSTATCSDFGAWPFGGPFALQAMEAYVTATPVTMNCVTPNIISTISIPD